MNILMVSSESVPFSKSGGLADVVGALSFSLAEKKNSVKVFMPLYGFIDSKGFEPLCSFSIHTLNEEVPVEIVSKTLDGVEFLGLKCKAFTKRRGIYGDTSFTPYPDNCYRYSLMCKAVIAYIRKMDEKFDVIHCHDWTTGLIPYLIKLEGLKIKTVFTIHNLAYQGDFSRYDLLLADIQPAEALFSGKGMEKRFNMLKTGLVMADSITTVSPTYAKEIQGPEQGCGLDGLLRERKNVLSGIINGIDYTEWDPMHDKFFSEHFSSADLSGKAKLKAALQEECGLEVDPDIPIVAMISRIAEQKGFAELLAGEPCALERFIREKNMQCIIIGTGNKDFEDKLIKISHHYRNISVKILFDNRMAHRVEGGADFFLMPSKYEPCGLNQLYSLRYGTLPIARRTGGLADSIIDLSDEEHGTGFLFDEMSGEGIYNAVVRALTFYKEKKKAFADARERSMKSDFTWDCSAKSYYELYTHLAGGADNE